MSIVVVVTFKAKENKYADLTALLKTLLISTSERPGAEVIRAAGNPEDNSVSVYEQWDSEESLLGYKTWSSENRDPSALIALLREAPTSEKFEHVF